MTELDGKNSSRYKPCSQNRSTATRTRHCKTGDLHARKLYNCKTRKLSWRSKQICKVARIHFAIIEAPPPQFIFFYFLLQIRRRLRLSVYAFYIRVKALYTLKHHPAESVASDFFHCGPSIYFGGRKCPNVVKFGTIVHWYLAYTIPSNEDYCCDKHDRIGRQKLSSRYRLCSQNRSTATRTRHCKTGDLHARKLYNCRTRKLSWRSRQICKVARIH